MKINKQRLWIMSWFTFTRRERNGVLTLTVVLFLLQLVLVYQRFIRPDLRPVPLDAGEKAIVKSLENENAFAGKYKAKELKSLPVLTQAVDPNDFSENEWIAQGLSPGQARVVMKWRNSGRSFKSKEDVKSMKFIPPVVFRNLEPWIEIRERIPEKRTGQFVAVAKMKMDLNTADTVLLCELPFIGPGRARTIWKFRERLGGFFEVEQLKEVRSLPDSVYQIILPRIEIRTPVYRKIDLNVLTDSLYHPYFPRPLLKMIVAYRTQNGFYRDPTEIRKLPLVDEDLWRKIAPYISISPPPLKP